MNFHAGELQDEPAGAGRGTAPLCRRQGMDAWQVGFGCATLRHSQPRGKKLCKPILRLLRLWQHPGYCQIPRDLPAEQFAGGSYGRAPSPYSPAGWPQGRTRPNTQLMRATAPISFNLCRRLSHQIDFTPRGASPPRFPWHPSVEPWNPQLISVGSGTCCSGSSSSPGPQPTSLCTSCCKSCDKTRCQQHQPSLIHLSTAPMATGFLPCWE